MRADVQQQAIRDMLDKMLSIAKMAPDQFTASVSEFCSLSDSVATLIKTPALPGLCGPKSQWINDIMVII